MDLLDSETASLLVLLLVEVLAGEGVLAGGVVEVAECFLELLLETLILVLKNGS